MSAQAVEQIDVRRTLGVAVALALAATAVAGLYAYRALTDGGIVPALVAALFGVIAAGWGLAAADSRFPLLVIDRQGLRLRFANQWVGLPWAQVAAVQRQRGLPGLRDGRLVALIDDRESLGLLGRRARIHARLTAWAYGSPYAVPLGLTTTVEGAGADLDAALAELAGRPSVAPGSGSATGAAAETEESGGPAISSETGSRIASGEIAEVDRLVADGDAQARNESDDTSADQDALPAVAGEAPGDDEDPEALRRAEELFQHDPLTAPLPPGAWSDPEADWAEGVWADADRAERPIGPDVAAGDPTTAWPWGSDPQTAPAPSHARPAVGGEMPRASWATVLRDPRPAVAARLGRLADWGRVASRYPVDGGNALAAAYDDEPEVTVDVEDTAIAVVVPFGRELATGSPAASEPAAAREAQANPEIETAEHTLEVARPSSTPDAEPTEVLPPLDDQLIAEPAPIGTMLRAARQARDLSRARAAACSGIPREVLEALERNDFAPSGGDFYVRGQLRTLGRVLGFDPEPLVARYDRDHAHEEIDARRVHGVDAESLATTPAPWWLRATSLGALGGVLLWACVRALG